MIEGVILIPGIMGSVLKKGQRTIWPGDVLELVLPYNHMADLLDPDLLATDVIRSVSISTQYKALIDSLESCGFHEAGPKPTLTVFPYDWRKDNALAAKALADCIDAMAQNLGNDAEINLVAHSMGGLVSRCYLESGTFTGRLGFACVKCLITLGTPHRGSPLAMTAAVGQERRLFLNADQVKTLASHTSFPSLYQLLPPKGEPFAWDREQVSRYAPVDVYDRSVATQLGLVDANLTAAENFHAMLDLNRRPAHVRYFFFAGTRQTTITSVQIRFAKGGGTRVIRVDRDDAGDGTVPVWSGSQSGIQMEPVGGEHGDLYKNGALKQVLGTLLGRPGVLMAKGLVPELSVRDKVLEPGGSTLVTIDFPQGTTTFEGELRMRRRVDNAGVSQPAAPVMSTYPISYSGAPIDHLSILIQAPDHMGIYEMGYVQKGSDENSATTELFIQGR
jgi:pimeloyl-ACP methyl ester carboxylesterase